MANRMISNLLILMWDVIRTETANSCIYIIDFVNFNQNMCYSPSKNHLSHGAIRLYKTKQFFELKYQKIGLYSELREIYLTILSPSKLWIEFEIWNIGNYHLDKLSQNLKACIWIPNQGKLLVHKRIKTQWATQLHVALKNP